MRAILTLLCIFAVTFSAQAQLFGKHWEKGYYVDQNGKKTEGQISWTPPNKGLFKGHGDAIYYKADEKADKIKIVSDSVQRFVMGTDTLVISHHPDLDKYPVLRVMLNNKIKIYQSVVTQQSGGGMMMGGATGTQMVFTPMYSMSNSTIYYGTSPEDITKLTRSDFVDVMSKIMADKPAVVEQIKAKKFRYGALADLIELYNTGIDPRKTTPKTDDAY